MSEGVWFGAEHTCGPDPREPRRYPELHWEQDAEGNDLSPRHWLVCDACGYAVALVIRNPDGKTSTFE